MATHPDDDRLPMRLRGFRAFLFLGMSPWMYEEAVDSVGVYTLTQ